MRFYRVYVSIDDGIPGEYGAVAHNKTEAARLVRERVLTVDTYEACKIQHVYGGFDPGNLDPGFVVCYTIGLGCSGCGRTGALRDMIEHDCGKGELRG